MKGNAPRVFKGKWTTHGYHAPCDTWRLCLRKYKMKLTCMSCTNACHSPDRFWRYGFETNWDVSTANDLEDYELSCAIITGLASRENTFMLNNHFSNNRVGLPSRDVAEVVNMKDFLQNRLDGCTEIIGRRTNLLSVDFWSIGDVVEVVNSNNAALPAVENIFSN